MGVFNLSGSRPGLLGPGGADDPALWNGVLGFGPAAPDAFGKAAAPTPALTLLPQRTSSPASGAPAQLAAQVLVDRPARAVPGSTSAGVVSPLDADAVRNIVFNETQSLNGDDLPAARAAMAQAIMNADGRWGPRRGKYAGTQPTTLPPKMDARQRQILEEVQAAVADAFALRAGGTDAVHGSTNYNLRENGSNKPPTWGHTFTSEHVFGPFPDNLGKPKYIDIWHNPQGG